MPKRLYIFGAGGYAKSAADACESGSDFTIAAFVERAPAQGASFMGAPVLAEEDVLGRDEALSVIVAVGDNWTRQRIVESLLKRRPDVRFETIVHGRSIVSRRAELAPGVVVLAGAIVAPFARVDEHVSIWTNAVLEHDSTVARFATLAPSATTGGEVHVGARAFLGLASTVRHSTTIGEDAVIGANTAVISDVGPREVVVGIPARVVRTRETGEPYL